MPLQQSHNVNLTEPLASNAEWVHEKSAQVKIKSYHGHTKPIKTCQLIENQNWILTGSNDNTARLWNFDNGKEIHKYELNHDMASISGVRINHDHTRLYSSSWDKTIHCFDIETGKQIWKGVQDHMITSCHISHDGNSLCSGSDLDGIVTIWDSKNGLIKTCIHDLHESTITSCQFNVTDNRLVSTSSDKTTKVFDLISHRHTITLRDHKSVVSNCTFNQCEHLYATCSWDRTVLLYDIATGRFRHEGPLALPKLHQGSISTCHMSIDGKILVTGGYDLKIIIWDLENMAYKLVLNGHRDYINDVCLTSDNKWIISVSNDCDIRLWDITNCDEIKQAIEKRKKLKNCELFQM
ncbi:unnamed protein product [Rotaria magnacalcarata]|uniref:Uncharacterized protein n=2 Tax=Rotaria magnacalcarata TaxID=392030 RepID=A0A816W4G6_9BILA|nr:unnamed protein product [Rotaria magnacalcarata]CAF3890032.1 unnamed protein product [Rotaria magnacalcarata]